MKKAKFQISLLTSVFFAFFLLNSPSQASDENQEISIKIQNHQFQPSEIEVEANKPFNLTIENLDKTIEEFESDDLKKEKLIGGGKKIMIPVAGLKIGKYKFYGDFHQKTAQGVIIVK